MLKKLFIYDRRELRYYLERLFDMWFDWLDFEDFFSNCEFLKVVLDAFICLDYDRTNDSEIFYTEYPWLAIRIAHF